MKKVFNVIPARTLHQYQLVTDLVLFGVRNFQALHVLNSMGKVLVNFKLSVMLILFKEDHHLLANRKGCG